MPDNRPQNEEDFPPRVAHVMHALIEASREANMPVTASEVQVYDEEALTARSTGAALSRARDYGLCLATGRYWVPTAKGLDRRRQFEDRYLAEVVL
jgi:hypothetical protein